MRSGVVVLFGMTSFLAAALLFSAQPMIGKMVLPVFGGTPAVWNTCLVYFQVMLLGGYLLGTWRRFAAKQPGAAGPAVSHLCVLAVLLTFGYLLQPIEIVPGLFSSSMEHAPALAVAWHTGDLGNVAPTPGLGDCALTSMLVHTRASSSRERSLLPLCRKQRRKPDGTAGLSARDRAKTRLEFAEPALAVRVSASGDAHPHLRYLRLAG